MAIKISGSTIIDDSRNIVNASTLTVGAGTTISPSGIRINTGIITAQSFVGDGSGLTGVTATGSGVVVQEEGANVGTATTINFVGAGATAVFSNGVATITISGGGGGGGGGVGNAIQLGSPTDGTLTGATTLQTTTTVTDAVDSLNTILGKLVPPAPPTIGESHAHQNNTLTLSGSTTGSTGYDASTYKLCTGFTPTNTAGTSITGTISAGTQYRRNRTASLSSSTITNRGPGDSGILRAYVNNTVVGLKTMTTSVDNGTYNATGTGGQSSGLTIASDQDAFSYYDGTTAAKQVNGKAITSGFYSIFNGTITSIPYNNAAITNGFNVMYLEHTDTSVYTTVKSSSWWYQDNSAPGTPTISWGTVNTPATPNYTYSSGVKHLDNNASNAFTSILTCGKLTGDMYQDSPISISAGGGSPAWHSSMTKTYTDFGGTNPPTQNFGVASNVTHTTSFTPVSNQFQVVSSSHFGSATITTPYGTASGSPSYTGSILFYAGTASGNKPDELLLPTTLTSLTGNIVRVTSKSATDNPSYTTGDYGTAWDQTPTLAVYEAAIVAGTLSHNVTNYGSGFFPSATQPDYSTGRSGAQYITYKIVRAATGGAWVTISITGTYAGLWMNVPTNTTWTTANSATNGWSDGQVSYAGAGIPGAGSGGNGTNGCGVAGSTSSSRKLTLGTANTSGSSDNVILIRFRLNSGQSITSLSMAPG